MAFVLASATPANSDSTSPTPTRSKVQKKVHTPVVHRYNPVPAAQTTPEPIYNRAPRPAFHSEPLDERSRLSVYGIAKTKHAFYRQAWIDYDACVVGGGLRLQSRGFHFGAEGLTDCDDEDRSNGTNKKHEKKKYWNHSSHTAADGTGFDRLAIYGGWQGNLSAPLVLDLTARHEFADDNNDVTRATGLVRYEFHLSERSTLAPYTGAEILLTDRDSECLDDTIWTLPVGVHTYLPLSHRFSTYGDASINFSDDDRQVAVVEVGAEFNFEIDTVPFILAPSGAWVSRFDDEDSSDKYEHGWHHKKYGRHCRGEDCREDDEFFVGTIEIRAKISNLF